MKLNDFYFVRGLQEVDADGAYPLWFEDQDVCAYNSHGKYFRTKEYFRHFIRNLNSEKMLVWAICHVQDGHIGNVALQNISHINRNAEFAIILGDCRHWGKGVGRVASKAIIEHGFKKLNLRKIYCATAATNAGMRKLAANLGMNEEGVQKEHLFLSGEWVDLIIYGIANIKYEH